MTPALASFTLVASHRGVSIIRATLVRICLLLLLLPCAAAWAQDGTPTERQRPLIAWDGDWQGAVGAEASAPFALRLPHVWTADMRTHDAAVVWYANSFTLTARTRGPALQLLLLDPVGQVEVFLDDADLGAVWGNGLTRALRLVGLSEGRHRVRLRLTASAIGPAGLGDVVLQVLPPVRVALLLPQPHPAEGLLTVRYRLEVDAPGPVSLLVEAFGPDRKRVAHTTSNFTLDGDAEGVAQLHIRLVVPWSPAKPRLYRVRVTLTRAGVPGDVADATTGMAAMTFARNRLCVNDAPIILHGLRIPGGVPDGFNATTVYDAEFTRLRQTGCTAVQADDGALKAVNDALNALYQTEFTRLRQAGFNAVMADGAALPDAAYTQADGLGLLIFGEAPVGPDGAPDVPAFLEQRAHHPCVVAWSWDAVAAPHTAVAAARALDPLRPVLVRNGDMSRVYGPGYAAGHALENVDFVWHAWDGGVLPGNAFLPLKKKKDDSQGVLVSNIALEQQIADAAPTGPRVLEIENHYLDTLRAVVELARLVKYPLGFFVRAPRGGTLSGLTTADGVPTRFFTTAVAFNQPLLVCLTAKPDVKLGQAFQFDGCIVNDAGVHGTAFRLYQQVMTPDGVLLLTRPHVVALSPGARKQPISGYLNEIAGVLGVYRWQVLLTDGASTYTSLRVPITVEVADTPPAALPPQPPATPPPAKLPTPTGK